MNERLKKLRDIVDSDDVEQIGCCLNDASLYGSVLDQPAGADGRPVLSAAKSIEAAERLLTAGASLQAVSEWWNPGFV